MDAGARPLPETDGAPIATAAADLQCFLTVAAIVRMNGLSGSARRLDCLALPSPVFEELCCRLLDRTAPIEGACTWLQSRAGGGMGVSRSSIFRFAAVLFKQFDLAWKSYAAGGPKGAK